jgi:hypothetical protein
MGNAVSSQVSWYITLDHEVAGQSKWVIRPAEILTCTLYSTLALTAMC